MQNELRDAIRPAVQNLLAGILAEVAGVVQEEMNTFLDRLAAPPSTASAVPSIETVGRELPPSLALRAGPREAAPPVDVKGKDVAEDVVKEEKPASRKGSPRKGFTQNKPSSSAGKPWTDGTLCNRHYAARLLSTNLHRIKYLDELGEIAARPGKFKTSPRLIELSSLFAYARAHNIPVPSPSPSPQPSPEAPEAPEAPDDPRIALSDAEDAPVNRLHFYAPKPEPKPLDLRYLVKKWTAQVNRSLAARGTPEIGKLELSPAQAYEFLDLATRDLPHCKVRMEPMGVYYLFHAARLPNSPDQPEGAAL